MTKAGDKPLLKLRGKIVGGPYDGETVWNQMTLTQDNDVAVKIFLRHLDAYGLDRQYLSQGPSMDQIAAALVGRQALWVLSLGSYQNKPKNNVDDTRPITGAGAAAPTVGAAPAAPAIPTPAVPTAAPQAPVPAPPVPVAPQPAPAPVPAPPVPVPVPTPVAPAPAVEAPPAPPF
jgi:hypothetical protein